MCSALMAVLPPITGTLLLQRPPYEAASCPLPGWEYPQSPPCVSPISVMMAAAHATRRGIPHSPCLSLKRQPVQAPTAARPQRCKRRSFRRRRVSRAARLAHVRPCLVAARVHGLGGQRDRHRERPRAQEAQNAWLLLGVHPLRAQGARTRHSALACRRRASWCCRALHLASCSASPRGPLALIVGAPSP